MCEPLKGMLVELKTEDDVIHRVFHEDRVESATEGLLKDVKDLEHLGTIWRYQDIELLVHKWFPDAINE